MNRFKDGCYKIDKVTMKIIKHNNMSSFPDLYQNYLIRERYYQRYAKLTMRIRKHLESGMSWCDDPMGLMCIALSYEQQDTYIDPGDRDPNTLFYYKLNKMIQRRRQLWSMIEMIESALSLVNLNKPHSS